MVGLNNFDNDTIRLENRDIRKTIGYFLSAVEALALIHLVEILLDVILQNPVHLYASSGYITKLGMTLCELLFDFPDCFL